MWSWRSRLESSAAGGGQVEQMLRPHGMSVDSKGNLYVGEASTGRRVQGFTPQRGQSRSRSTGTAQMRHPRVMSPRHNSRRCG